MAFVSGRVKWKLEASVGMLRQFMDIEEKVWMFIFGSKI